VKANSLATLITDVEQEYGLTKSSINIETVKYRIKRHNSAVLALQGISPLAETEPLIVLWCLMLSEMGTPLTRDGIIKLANDIVDGTIHSDWLMELKSKQITNNEKSAGAIWYRGVHRRNSDFLKRSKCKIKDQNRLNWCTYKTVFEYV
jgi:hypothetical protein